MVFCGKPSRACQPCRTMRRKCDLATPSCNQCLRAQIQCRGYRDLSQISFRDETASVSYKAQRKAKPGFRSSKCLTQLESPVRSSSCSLSAGLTLLCSFSEIETIATTHFLNSYVTDTTYSYLPRYWRNITKDERVNTTILPIAIASFASSSKQPKLLNEACIRYSAALVHIKDALKQTETAIEDSTLLSVLLLAMYESLTFRGRLSPSNWIMHVKGLTTILRLREAEKPIHNELGEYVVRHACYHIMTYCLAQKLPIPQHVQRIISQERLLKHECGILGGHHLDTTALFHGCTSLRINMRGMLATDVVRECLRLEDMTRDVMSTFHELLPYTLVTTKDHIDKNQYDRDDIHFYSSQNAARRWNLLRLIQLALNDWMYCAFDPKLRGVVLDTPHVEDELYPIWHHLPLRALETFDIVVEDILASIPYSRGVWDTSSISGARFLVWPLTTAAASEICSQDIKDFIITQLKDLNSRDGLTTALEAAMMLEEGAPMEEWLNMIQFS